MVRSNAKAVSGSVAIIAIALLAAACVVRHYHKSVATALMQEYILVPAGAQLATFPQGMPGNGYSGRATNVEDYTDPYGGGDVPGPYGRVNDPYDGDWALGPLGGKAVAVQGLRAVRMNPAEAAKDHNIWDDQAMGTNSIFMGNMPQSEVEAKMRRDHQHPLPQQRVIHSKDPNAKSFDSTAAWVGTNAAFFGANGGGTGLARGKKVALPHTAAAKKAGNKVYNDQKKLKAAMQSLFRSEDPHKAEYGLEGENQLDESVLPSDVGSGGPVIGVDGKPSNMAHEWVHVKEPFTFKCNPDIWMCKEGLTVAEEYAND